ncbi:hypothetical protein WA026_005913 [Henosepilachna vigintioctopunctata]|uniref:transaldolase n=1 Tax=Henosepilachna vigintioctopunctata TaxID=420089 RepID=A0AAW1U4M3_9CUCU
MSYNNNLEQLKTFTKVAADTGKFEVIKKFGSSDATTNPCLILEAANEVEYKYLIEKAAVYGKKNANSVEEQVENAKDMLTVLFGLETVKVVTEKVSVQINPKLAFDKEASISKARKLIKLFEDHGISKDKVLIKLPSTWESIQAAKELEAVHGIHCNMTLLFSFVQAVACADAGVTMVAPFVGGKLGGEDIRNNDTNYKVQEDPGVILVNKIFDYYKKFNYRTVIMGAYLRNIDQIVELAGCDYLTISPVHLEELATSNYPVQRKLCKENAIKSNLERMEISEVEFRWLMNEECTGDALSDGIRMFTSAWEKLGELVMSYL